MKKLIALLTCLMLVVAMLTGCSSSQVEEYDEPEEITVGETEDAEETESTEDATAEDETAEESEGLGYAAYDPDTVVGVVNGDEITWMEYYYWTNYYVQYVTSMLSQYSVTLGDWSENQLSTSMTNAEVVMENVQYAIIQYRAMEAMAENLGVTLDEDDEATVESVFESNADSVSGDGDGECTEEEATAFEEYLAEQNVDREFFDYLSEISVLSEKIFEQLYGTQAVNYSDEDVAAYVEENGLMAAKHILLLTQDTSTGESLSDEEIEEKKAQADELYEQLAAAEDQESLVALFDELMAEYTEDTGYTSYPDGYIFGEGEMVTEFETAVEELEEYGLSEVVESTYGYHIILRIPVDPDNTYRFDSSGTAYSVRLYAANDAFSEQISSWMDQAEVTWNEGFEALDMEAIFG